MFIRKNGNVVGLNYFEKDLVSILKKVPNELDNEPLDLPDDAESDGVDDKEDCVFFGIFIGIDEVGGGVKYSMSTFR